MSTQSDVVLVSIPDASASRSKMQKKHWKCWAKWLISVKDPANDGYAYEGEFTNCGMETEARIGDVILHVDQSDVAGVGVVMRNSKGAGLIKWMKTAPASGREWCGPLGRPARELLAMSVVDRIRHVARIVADDKNTLRSPEAQSYWDGLASGGETEIKPVEESPPADDPAIEIMRQLADAVERSIVAMESVLAQEFIPPDVAESIWQATNRGSKAMRSFHRYHDKVSQKG